MTMFGKFDSLVFDSLVPSRLFPLTVQTVDLAVKNIASNHKHDGWIRPQCDIVHWTNALTLYYLHHLNVLKSEFFLDHHFQLNSC